jgi:hypothetical protein
LLPEKYIRACHGVSREVMIPPKQARLPVHKDGKTMNTGKFLVSASVALLMASQAGAAQPHATLAGIDGTVMVNQGEQFRTAADGMSLKAGDRVMIMTGGSATLSFDADCVIPLESNSIVTVPEGSPCAGATVQTQATSPMFAQAVGDRYTDSDGNVWYWVAGGVLIAAASYYCCFRSSSSSP